MGVLLVVMFIVFVAIGVPISFALGVVSFTGIASLGQIPNLVVFQKMFNGLNSFTLLAVPLFILAANLMNEGEITEKLIDCCNSLVGHLRRWSCLFKRTCIHDLRWYLRFFPG